MVVLTKSFWAGRFTVFSTLRMLSAITVMLTVTEISFFAAVMPLFSEHVKTYIEIHLILMMGIQNVNRYKT